MNRLDATNEKITNNETNCKLWSKSKSTMQYFSYMRKNHKNEYDYHQKHTKLLTI